MKYIIFQAKDSETQIPYVITFDDAFVHRDVARTVGRGSDGRGFYVVSAGFFYRGANNKIITTGKSDSLEIGPQPNDSAILTLSIDHGLSAIDILNQLTLLELQGMKRGNQRKHSS